MLKEKFLHGPSPMVNQNAIDLLQPDQKAVRTGNYTKVFGLDDIFKKELNSDIENVVSKKNIDPDHKKEQGYKTVMELVEGHYNKPDNQ